MSDEHKDFQSMLRARFPQMKPIGSPPALGSINGCGFMVYGERDRDTETGTYVKTLCFCLVFVPVLMLRAYRVADASPRGWYFLGSEPLSMLAKGWNAVVLFMAMTIGVGVWWGSVTSSPDYKAGLRVAAADDLRDDGKPGRAAIIYKEVATGATSHAAEASKRLDELVSGALIKAPAKDAKDIVDAAIAVRRRSKADNPYGDLYAKGVEAVLRIGEADPRAASELLEALRPAAPDEKEFSERQLALLERVLAKEPNDVALASRLAESYEATDNLDKCQALLEPMRDKLGDSEAARILGQIYAAKGEHEKAYTLLEPYVKQRLNTLHNAETAYQKAVEQAWKRELNILDKGRGPKSFYRQYERANEAAQEKLVQDYMAEKLRNDGGLADRREALRETASVVPVALDLGMVMLNRAQSLPDPAARRKELEAAEKTFLAIQGVAGETDEYRLYLGQVYYWLGRHAEGHKLFDELLASHDRSHEWLTMVATSLRNLGDTSAARQLAEEAYNTAPDKETKARAARLRSVMQVDADDAIKWLKLADPNDPEVKASLNSALGSQAIARGDRDAAKKHLRIAIDAYDTMIESTVSLNNCALVYFQLYRLGGDRKDFDRGVEMMDKAVRMSPSESILLGNTASVILNKVVLDTTGDAIDFLAADHNVQFDALNFLYDEESARRGMIERFMSHPDTARAASYGQKVMLLRPKNVESYALSSAVYAMAEDADELESVLKRVRGVELDMVDARKLAQSYHAGERDKQMLAEARESSDRLMRAVKATASVGGATHALAVSTLVEHRMTLVSLGQAVDADETVKLAETAYAAAPSNGSRYTLVHALLLRAAQNLTRIDASFGQMVNQYRRSLGVMYLIPVAMERGGALAQAVSTHPDVRRAQDLVEVDTQRLPATSSPWTWAMLQGREGGAAQRVAAQWRTNRVRRLGLELDGLLSPFDATLAWKTYWAAKMTGGDPAAGLARLRAVAAAGVPTPMP
ncbi:MAG: tetratricopeptide repeat protein [Phycisphaera sp.]|nr:tetratricopeptide repeat protein [Phycisphaera sp.]